MGRLGLTIGGLGLCVLSTIAVSGCAVERAETAANAKTTMMGMAKGDVLACMGVPSARDADGGTEVWSYASGDGRTVGFSTVTASALGQSFTSGNAAVLGNTVAFGSSTMGAANTNSFGFGMARRFYCTVNVVFQAGRVSRVSYTGPTGPLLAPGEQCAYAVQNCVH